MTEKFVPKTKGKSLIDDTVPSFIKKTYDILEEGKFPDVIDWNSEGTALIIKKPTEFCQKVLPLYFKHNNLTSFIRQLNMYNFHKRRTQDVDHIYCHELFQRGKKHLLKEIKRKNHEHFHCIQKTFDALESIQNGQDSPSITQENVLLKKLNNEALVRVSTLDRRLKDLNYQNQALWNQICNQNEREELLKGLLINLMKQYGLSSSQLPSLVKNNPQLLVPTDKSVKESLLKTISSQNFINASQDQTKLASDRSNIENSLSLGNNTSENRDTSSLILNSSFPFYQNFQTLKSEPEGKIVQSNTQSGLSTPFKKENYVQGQLFHGWNLEAEYLKTFTTADQRFNTEYVDNHTKTRNSELLGKRHLEFEEQCKNPFEFQRREPWEEFEDSNLFIKKETPNKDSLMNEDNPKPGIFKNLKSEEFDLNSTIDLMNFNKS